MKKVYALILCGLVILSIAGCGTVKGVGEDITTLGRWLTRGSNNVNSDARK